jgi:endonuclease/exonuclease/phosphatase family metal-dependent hydrolase
MKRIVRVLAWIVGIVVGALVLLITTCILLNYRTPSPTDLTNSRLLASPPNPLSEGITLKVVTFNIWDLWHEGSHHQERMAAIGQKLCALQPDVVGLQEAFVGAHRKTLLDTLADCGLNSAMYFPSGLAGSGLLVVSRYPIEEAFFLRYSQGGKAHKVNHGDWWAGKGVCLARLELPDGTGYLDFFNTHAHARYGSTEYDSVRISQMKELAAFINTASLKTAPALSVGDYNIRPEEPHYQTLVEEAAFNRMMTIDTRIDHIFAVESDLYIFDVLETVPIKADVPLKDGKTDRLSDHTGYMSTIRIRPAND